MRLIDADELLDQLETLLKKSEEEAYYSGRREATVRWDDAIISIKIAPTVDPVKHGRWIEHGKDDNRCSLCGWGVWVNTNKFCPNCGARMDQEADHDDHL